MNGHKDKPKPKPHPPSRREPGPLRKQDGERPVRIQPPEPWPKPEPGEQPGRRIPPDKE